MVESRHAGEVHSFFEVPHDNPPKSLLTLTTYIDESQHEGKDRHVVVAGFCGSEDQWKTFLPAWMEALKPRKSLHMNTLRWNDKSAEKRVKSLLARLGPIPYQHHLSPVYGAVKVSDYFDLIEGEPELERKMCAYNLCLSVIFSVLVRDLPGYAKMNIVCEQQKQYEPLARILFDSFSKMVSKKPENAYFSKIEFIPKDSSPLTQPSDFLAFAITKYHDERGGKKDLWCRPIFGNKAPERISGRHSTREKARSTVREILAEIKKRHHATL